MKEIDIIKTITGGFVAGMTYLFGGMDKLFMALVILMLLDYISGITAAAMEGKLSSSKGIKGIYKKTAFLMVVAVAHIIDGVMALGGVARTLVISFLIANEGLSILENCGNIGVPIPNKLLETLEKFKGEQK